MSPPIQCEKVKVELLLLARKTPKQSLPIVSFYDFLKKKVLFYFSTLGNGLQVTILISVPRTTSIPLCLGIPAMISSDSMTDTEESTHMETKSRLIFL